MDQPIIYIKLKSNILLLKYSEKKIKTENHMIIILSAGELRDLKAFVKTCSMQSMDELQINHNESNTWICFLIA